MTSQSTQLKEIKNVRDKMPKLGPLVGAMKLHEILISSEGVVKKKNLPSDIFYQNVNIRESRRARRVEAGAAQLEDGEASEGESDDEY